MARRPLSERPLDLLYFTFFLIHIPASLLVDFQALYPPAWVPAALAWIPDAYLALSNDPLIGGVLGARADPAAHVWFSAFLYLEALFQLPVFVLGARGLYNDSRAIYILLLIYGASTSTTLLPCLAVLLTAPTSTALAAGAAVPPAVKAAATLTGAQRALLLASYGPFFAVPALMTLDMARRLAVLARRGAAADEAAKRR